MIKTQLCGSFLQLHLSTTADVQVAKDNLARLSLIVDLEAEPERSAHLLTCVLGFKPPTAGASTVFNANTKHSSRAELNTTRLQDHLALDYEMYDFAIGLIRSHAAATGYH